MIESPKDSVLQEDLEYIANGNIPLDELKNRIRDLENINSTLICEIDDLKALLKANGIL